MDGASNSGQPEQIAALVPNSEIHMGTRFEQLALLGLGTDADVSAIKVRYFVFSCATS